MPPRTHQDRIQRVHCHRLVAKGIDDENFMIQDCTPNGCHRTPACSTVWNSPPLGLKRESRSPNRMTFRIIPESTGISNQQNLTDECFKFPREQLRKKS
jgi:hypothetical protein